MDAILPKGVKLRGFDDPIGLRDEILDRVKNAYQSRFPLENDRVRLELDNLAYPDQKFGIADEKKALLTGGRLALPLTGRMRLFDKKTNQLLDEKQEILARVPWMSHRGTYINGGNEYSLVAGQQRLKPGVYSRHKENGELESHINTVAGTGSGMRIFMEPQTGVYRVMIGKSRIKLYPILKGLGVDDQEMAKFWGTDLLDINKQEDDKNAFGKFYSKLLGRRALPEATDKDRVLQIIDELKRSEVDEEVTGRTLGLKEKNLNPNLILRASQKLLNIQRGLEDEDDRDSMANKFFVGPEDLFEERVTKDTGKMGRSLLSRASYARTLDHFRPGYFTPQLEGLIVGNSLSNHIDGINPIQIFDYQRRVVQTGEGAISNMEAVPMSARNVHPSQMMVIDPIRSSESRNIGVDQRFSAAARKGNDKKIYFPLRNRKTGKVEYVDPVKMSESVVAFPSPKKLVDLFPGDPMTIQAMPGAPAVPTPANPITTPASQMAVQEKMQSPTRLLKI